MAYRGRFAPSPTGPLHLGSLVAAVGSWLRARAQNGAWLVRVEDIDPPREVRGAANEILATLAAFGLQPGEAPLHQSTRTAAYRQAFERLERAGHVFPCWCSRSDLEIDAGIHRACRAPPDPARAPAWRLRAPDRRIGFTDGVFGPLQQNLREEVGDFVIRRVEGWFAYQLAVVVDDEFQRISEVVRGADLLDSTPRQIYLQELLGFATPSYVHLPLVLDANGQKLSKSDFAHPIDRDDPLPALREALRLLGFEPPSETRAAELLHAALRDFDLARIRQVVTRSPSHGTLKML